MAAPSLSVVKQYCRRSADERSRRALFTHAGRRDKLPDRLSALTGVPIDQDDLSEFVCRKCGSELDKYTRKIAEAEDLKRELSATTFGHRSILKWSGKKAEHAPASPSPECSGLVGTKMLSMLRKKSESDLIAFQWDKLMAELQERTPTLLSLMSAVADKTWNRKTTTVPAKCALQVCVACAILMKARNMHMCAAQTIVSLLLNAGHVSSLVSVGDVEVS